MHEVIISVLYTDIIHILSIEERKEDFCLEAVKVTNTVLQLLLTQHPDRPICVMEPLCYSASQKLSEGL